MRPPSVFAQVPDEQYHQLVSALHHQWRTAARIVMVLLSVYGWPPAQIAAFLHYHPGTVRRWIDRHDIEGLAGLPDRPRSGRPASEDPGWANASAPYLPPRKRGPPPGSGGRWGAPP